MGDLLLDEQWAVAELRIAALITRIQPNGHSEERRKAVIDYVQRLIQRCFDCQVKNRVRIGICFGMSFWCRT
eukprot:c2202_g1_i1 orf=331-546(+)